MRHLHFISDRSASLIDFQKDKEYYYPIPARYNILSANQKDLWTVKFGTYRPLFQF